MKAIDLFAGAGGWMEGAQGTGVDIVYAANHWPFAVEMSTLNHPKVRHECQDLRQADWTQLPAYDLLLASPSCQGHSTASQPKRRRYHDVMRATAWAVVDCAEVTQPRAIIVENVPSFRTWKLYDVWKEALTLIGYQLQEHVVMATDYGVAQRRERLIVVATPRPIKLHLPKRSIEPAFAPHLEVDAGNWKHVADTTDQVRARIAKGRRNCGPTFLSQHVTGHPGVPLSEPIRTITTKDQWIFVDGDRYRPLTLRELARGMSFRDSFRWPNGATRTDTVKALGNAIPPKMARTFVAQVAEAV
jgi:DNA (cytosine-5)-methyltransferase 1